ncbi:MAG: hypothetical protein R3C28_33015 [Pirellulaceae bacterium]
MVHSIQFARYHDFGCSLVCIGCSNTAQWKIPLTKERWFLAAYGPLLAVLPEFHPIRRVRLLDSGSAESARTIRHLLRNCITGGMT